MGRAGPLLDVVSGCGIVTLAGAAAAVAAGTVPDVIKSWLGDQRPFLTVLCLVSALTFAAINLWQRRSKGAGTGRTTCLRGMRTWIQARPQIAAPVTIAFALGRLLGHEVKAVPHPYQTSDDKAGAPCISS